MTEPATAVEERSLPSLTSLRWYAALLVFGYHLDQHGFFWRPAKPLIFGYTGVAFFFVLSGFVLAWSSGATVARGRFYYRRFARIYPLHLATFALVGLVALAEPGLLELGGRTAALSLTLTQAWIPGYHNILGWNGPSWSLSSEAFFYACFPFLLPWLRRVPLRRACAVVAVSLVVAMALTLVLREQGRTGISVAAVNPVIRFPEFALGVLLAVAMRRGELRPRLPLWAPLLLVVVLGALSWRGVLAWYPFADYLMLPGYALLIVVAASGELRDVNGPLERFFRHRVSVYLGELSFAFYLVHEELVLYGVNHALGWRHDWSLVGGVGPTLVLLLVSVAGSMVLHHAVERPARRFLLRAAARPRRRAVEPEPG